MNAPQRNRPWLWFSLRIAFLLVLAAVCGHYLGMRAFSLSWLFVIILTSGIGEWVVSWSMSHDKRPIA
jgi:hypothetical protein